MTPKHAHDPDTFAAALAETARPEPYPPGTEVWVSHSDEYLVEKGKVISYRNFVALYIVACESGNYSFDRDELFPTEAAALDDLRKYAAGLINRCREQIAQAEAFLGRPQ